MNTDQLTRKRFHMPELDGLRFLAFLLVFLHHAMPDPNGVLNCFRLGGWVGVDVFLTLSSFLITSLLLREHQKANTISLSSFYMRRILRIWPLFFLFLTLNYLLVPIFPDFPSGFADKNWEWDRDHHVIPLLVFAGNWSVAVFSYSTFGFAAHLWTICLEEQFYIFWPLIASKALGNLKHFAAISLSLLLFSLCARWYYHHVAFSHPAMWVSTFTRLDPFAWGSLLAIGWYRHGSTLHATANRGGARLIPVAGFVLAGLGLCALLSNWGFGEPECWWKMFIVDFLVAAILCSILLSKPIATVLSLRPLAWLGKISYGLYVYHIFFVSLYFIHETKALLGINNLGTITTFQYWYLQAFLLLCTITMSAISYYGFEIWFLRLKGRWTTVASRPN